MKCPECGAQTYRSMGGKDICPRCGYGASFHGKLPASPQPQSEAPASSPEQTRSLVPLICSQCGGKLEVAQSQVAVEGESVKVLPDQAFRCPYCETEYVAGHFIARHSAEREARPGPITIVGDGVVIGDHSSSTITRVGREEEVKDAPKSP